MPRLTKRRPKYCGPHKPSGLAFCTWEGRRRYFRGAAYGTPESWRQYDEFCREYVDSHTLPVRGEETSVAELVVQFLHWARGYCSPKEYRLHRDVARFLDSEEIKHLPTNEFGPALMRHIRDEMVAADWARTTINNQVGRLRRIFRWGVSRELVRPETLVALQTIESLRRGKTAARESARVKPVSIKDIDEVLAVVSPNLKAMILVQRLTGMRPGNLCTMRPADIDMKSHSDVWVYVPPQHKSAWRELHLFIPLGPQTQSALAPLLEREANKYLFSPRETAAWQSEQRRLARKTPLTPAHTNRTIRISRLVRNRYTPDSYRQAVAYACHRAGVPVWRPNQLRHTCATLVRSRFGIEAAQVCLGHTTADTTQIYAERNLTLALKVARELG